MTPEPLSLHILSASDWLDCSAAFQDLTYEQSLTYAQAAARRIGAEPQFVRVETPSGQIVAAACLRIKRLPALGRGIAWIAAGPLLRHRDHPDPSPETVQAVLAALRAHATATGHILRLRFPVIARYDVPSLDELAASQGFVHSERSPSYRTVVVDCDQDEDTLMRALHGKWRNPLRNALKAGLELDIVPIAEARSRFHALYQDVQATKGFRPDIPPEFYYGLTGSDFDHEVLFARKDGADIAGMTIGRAGINAVYLFGATAEAGRRLNAGHYLMWHSILRCKELGMKFYDLGGIDPDSNPTVTRFKHRTGGADLQAAGPYEFQPKGLTAPAIRAAETLHSLLKRRRK